MGSIPLLLQTRLDHRGGVGLGGAPLFPPPGTFEALGGHMAITRLVDGLYDRIGSDTTLRPAFNRDLTREREKLKLFFEAWFGGAPTYFNADWPPGLKAAHGLVSISRGMALRWIGHFLASVAEEVKDPAIINHIKPCISRLAMALVNRVDEPVPGERLRDVSDPGFLHSVQRDAAAGIAASAAEYPHALLLHGPRLLLVAAVRGKVRAAQELLRQGVKASATSGIIIELGAMMAHGSTSIRFSAEMCGPRLVEFAKRWFSIVIDIVQRPTAQPEFVVQPHRWKIERTFGWLDWSRILSKEYERTTESSESDIYLASIRLMLRRLVNSAM